MNNQNYVYLMTNKSNKVLYTGVTNDLKKRIYEHKEKLVDGFTKRYNLTKLVYFETCGHTKCDLQGETNQGWFKTEEN
jgi:putative endonuclease